MGVALVGSSIKSPLGVNTYISSGKIFHVGCGKYFSELKIFHRVEEYLQPVWDEEVL